MGRPVHDKALFIFFILALFLMQGCKILKPIPQAERVGVKLNYSFPPGEWLHYKQTQNIDQNIKVGQQDIKVIIDQIADFLISGSSESGEEINLNVRLNNLAFDINAGGQLIKPDLNSIKGKEFGFTLTKYGKELNMQETDAINFEIVPSEKSDLTSIFKGIFPDLPGGAIKKGKSWDVSDTIIYKDENRSSVLILNNTHTLNGFVEMDGYNCAEVNSVSVGTIKSVSKNQGMEIETDAAINGTSVWYFAFDKGVFIKESSQGVSDGIIKTPQGDLSLVRKFNIETKLIETGSDN